MDLNNIKPSKKVEIKDNSISANKTSQNDFIVYPTPIQNKLNIFIPGLKTKRNLTLMIIDINGKTVYETHVSQGANSIDLDKINHGIYMLSITQEGRIIHSGRIVK